MVIQHLIRLTSVFACLRQSFHLGAYKLHIKICSYNLCIFYTWHKRKEGGHFASKLNIRVISIVSFEVKYAVLIAIVRRVQESSK
jgi:hypothetical protein